MYHIVLTSKNRHGRAEDVVIDRAKTASGATRAARALARERFGRAEFKAEPQHPSGGHWFDADPGPETEDERITIKQHLTTSDDTH